MKNNHEIRKLIGIRLRKIRKIYGLSVDDLSQKSKVSKSTIYGIECGKINTKLTTIEKLSIAMKHSAYDFFDF